MSRRSAPEMTSGVDGRWVGEGWGSGTSAPSPRCPGRAFASRRYLIEQARLLDWNCANIIYREAMSDFDGALEVYSRSGIGLRVGFGDRAAILVVDLQNGFTDPASPVGDNLDDVTAATARLLEVG